MKLHKHLTVAGEAVQLITDDVRLKFNTPGLANFAIAHTSTLAGIVIFSMGYDRNKLQQYFVGYVENVVPANNEQQTIFCREISAVLKQKFPLSIRNASLKDVTEKAAEFTKLNFITADQPYSNKPVACVSNMANGYHLMDSLGELFNISQYIWQQQGDGSIYVGSWQHSFWANKPATLDIKYQMEAGLNKFSIGTLPRIRPGVLLNGVYVTAVQQQGNKMVITWHKNPWSKL